MTNHDRLQQITSNVLKLSDLVSSMIDSEMYPVSFFSQAFDLIQKLQSDFHTLEAEQVELFAEQLKKHQALILSIHQQMRHFSTQTQNIISNVANPEIQSAPIISTSAHPASVKSAVPPETTEVIVRNESAPPPYPLPPPAPVMQPPTQPAKPTPPAAPMAQSARPVSPPDTPMAQPARPVPPPDVPVARPARPIPPPPPDVPVARPARPMPPPDVPAARPVRPISPESMPEPDLEAHGIPPVPAPPVPDMMAVTRNDAISKDAPSLPTLNDAIEKKNSSDLRKAFSLNDHFRYRKELFNGSEEMMNKVITILNNHHSLKESIAFIEQKLHWDFSDPTVKDFVKKLEIRFLGPGA